MKKTRVICLVLALLMMLSLFAACTDKPAADTEEVSATEEAKIVLSLGIYPEPTNEAAVNVMETQIARYQELYPNVEVIGADAQYKYAPDTFIPLAEAGTVPTIFESWFTEPQKLIANGWVRDITDLLAARGWLDKINPSIRALLSDANGRVYGIPRDGYALGLHCNVELFEEAGLRNDDGSIQYPKTWTELAETGKKIKDATGAAGLCLLAQDNAGGWNWSNIAWAFGAELVTVENGKFVAHLDSPEAIAAMEFTKSLKWEYDILTEDPTVEGWGTGFAQVGTGNCAMYIGANDAVEQTTKNNGLAVESFVLAPMPGEKKQFSLSGGTQYMFAPNATDEEVNAALDFLVIMGKSPEVTDDAIAGMRADAQTKVADGVPVIPRFPCWVNSNAQAEEDKIVAEFKNVEDWQFADYFKKVSEPGNLHLEEVGDTQEMYRELTAVLQAVVTDKNADVAALLKVANDNYQEILDSGLNK